MMRNLTGPGVRIKRVGCNFYWIIIKYGIFIGEKDSNYETMFIRSAFVT